VHLVREGGLTDVRDKSNLMASETVEKQESKVMPTVYYPGRLALINRATRSLLLGLDLVDWLQELRLARKVIM